jgi:hypothetical protein
MIWASVYLLVFLNNLIILARKFYFCSPLLSGGITNAAFANGSARENLN